MNKERLLQAFLLYIGSIFVANRSVPDNTKESDVTEHVEDVIERVKDARENVQEERTRRKLGWPSIRWPGGIGHGKK